MDPLTAIAASGLRARMESLDLLANNVANASTSGYKADREFYSLYFAPEAADSDDARAMPLIERPWTDLAQGPIHSTGNPFDLALSGKGFFVVDGPSGPLYTRNGAFQLSAAGQLVTSDGYPVRKAGGGALKLEASLPFEISRNGSVVQSGNTIGQIDVADFTSTGGLFKQGASYFRSTDSVKPAAASRASIEQGKLEGSNTGSAESAVRLVSVLRQFEMLQRAVTLGAEMNRRAVEEVAKVGS